MLLQGLIATRNAEAGRQLAELLSHADIQLTQTDTRDLWAGLSKGFVDILFAEVALLPGDPTAAVAAIRALPDPPQVVVLDGDAEHRAALLAAGAFAVLDTSTSQIELQGALATLVQRSAREIQLATLADSGASAGQLSDFSTASPVMRDFLALVRKVVSSDSTLLITGETGVGKEYLARAIHAASPRHDAPFVAVNCAALSESVLASELFGHVAGAFTGAQRSRRGYFDQAHRGTLFLDEVGELPPSLQVTLLRFLQDHRIQPVGAESDHLVDVRILAATNRDLVADRDAGLFRSDLFYRLSVVSLPVPALRDRAEDIDGLVERHVQAFARTMKRPVHTVDAAAMSHLRAYRWPGNVRELVNVIERAVLLSESDTIGLADLPRTIRETSARRTGAGAISSTPPAVSAEAPPPAAGDPLDAYAALPYHDARRKLLDDFDLRYVRAALARCHGRIQDAARLAGLNARSLYAKMKRHGVRKESFKI